jgi:RNA polymerase sigma-70 factor (ECF subfamily)
MYSMPSAALRVRRLSTVLDAFFQAARGGHVDALVALLQPALVNGSAGVVVIVGGRPITLAGFTVAGGKIVEIHVIADPQRVRRLAAAVLSG